MYKKAKFLRLIKTDMFLQFTWKQYKKTVPADQLDRQLEAMYNTYVAEDSVMLRLYEAA